MRIAYLDCFSGISGDMFLGALLDAGVPFELFQKTVVSLNVGANLELSRVDRSGISATKLDVLMGGEKDLPREEFWAQHPHEHNHSHAPARSLKEILSIIAAADISESAKKTASEIFRALGEAEAKVHNVAIEAVHFHEVGAADAIVDIVCAAVGAEALGVEQFICSPLNVGSGTVACDHGVMPVPAPATLELLQGIPIYSGEIEKELVTPTGAALVKTLASSFGPRPLMTCNQTGYGAGSRNFPRHSNVLRITIGDAQRTLSSPNYPAAEEVLILETNLDDLSPQLIAHVAELAFTEGALDVFTTPVQMKKGRPGTVITVLARPEAEAVLLKLLFRESSTLGVRTRREKRYALPRRYESVATPWGEVRMKIANLNGSISQYAPEFEDCRRIAAAHHLPLKTVMQEAIRVYLDRAHG